MSVGIYNEGFITYLEKNLGAVKTNPKNIITNCPWCDIGVQTSKSHLWISMTDPIFHCFRGGCNQSGLINKLTEKIEGIDTSNVYVNKSLVQQFKVEKIKFEKNEFKHKKIILPEINEDLFKLKTFYLKQRFKFNNIPLSSVKGLVFDVDKLIELNHIQLDEQVIRFKDYLQSNFIGFLTENHSCISLRNIDSKSNFRYYKLHLQPAQLLDYYKIYGGRKNSKHIIMAEGIFDIYSEHIYDILKLKDKAAAYVAALSTSYAAAIKSIVFNEQIYRPIIHILSDREVPISYYKKIMKYNSHIIDSMFVYYNKTGKDFNDTPINISCTTILSN
jgi:hypothetical protein